MATLLERIKASWELIKSYEGKVPLDGRRPLPLFDEMIDKIKTAVGGHIYIHYIFVWNVFYISEFKGPGGPSESYILYKVKDGVLELWPPLVWEVEKEGKIVALTGDTRSSQKVEELRKHGIGRMFVEKTFWPYPKEPWGFDNGAYSDYLNGKEFDPDRYERALEKALWIIDSSHPPYISVLPDIVGGGQRSLELSINWLDKKLYRYSLNWYLAVQDGMTPEEVKQVLLDYPQIKGLFLGGTDAFKKTAKVWSSLAHSLGRKFHYARAGSMKKVKEAIRAEADSLDSALPLWTKEKFRRFIKALTTPTQLELPLTIPS